MKRVMIQSGRIVTLLALVVMLTACPRSKVFSSKSMFAPRPPTMGKGAENAPAEYKQGWNDGCETGMSTMNMNIYKNFYGYKQDISMMNNPLYYKAWKDAYTYCRQYTFRFMWYPYDSKKGNGWLQNGPLCVLCPNEIR